MLDILPVILGIILLIKGSFSIAGRYVARPTARFIGALLIAPSVFTFCAGSVMGAALLTNDAAANTSGQIVIDMNNPELQALFDQLVSIQLVLLAGAVALSIYMIWRSPTQPVEPTFTPPPAPTGLPRSGAPWNAPPPFTPAAPPKAPDIMTVPEAAAYLRITEPELLALIEGGKLPAARMGGNNYRIARIAIEDFLNNQT